KGTRLWGIQNLFDYLAWKIYDSVGMPVQKLKFVRYYVNGGYYGYVGDRGPAEELLAIQAEPETKGAGDYFKLMGTGDTGPWSRDDFRPLRPNPSCCSPESPMPACTKDTMPQNWVNQTWARYLDNYKYETNSWKDVALRNDPMHPRSDIQAVIEDLDAARKQD